MIGWAKSQDKNWQEVHGTYDEVVMGNYRIVHIFLISKSFQDENKMDNFYNEKVKGWGTKNGRPVDDPSLKDPFLSKMADQGKLERINKHDGDDFPYQVLNTYMKRNKEMAESMRIAREYSLGKMLETINHKKRI